MQKMYSIKKTLKPILLGIIIASILLFVFPGLKNKTMRVNTNTIKNNTETQPAFSFASALKKATPAVVFIFTTNLIDTNNTTPQLQRGLGSGVLMNENGFILTNNHVIASSSEPITVYLHDTRKFHAQLIGHDLKTDLAVLKINGTNLPVIPQNENYKPTVGDLVFAIGNPYNLGQTTTMGIISAVERNNIRHYEQQELIQTDAAINQGNSGGALVNSNGELVGINTISYKETAQAEVKGISFAIPYTTAKYIMTQIIANGRVIRGSVGITGKEVYGKSINTPQNYGISISTIIPNSPAEKAGLLPDDIITDVDNEPVYIASLLFNKLQQLKPGTKIVLTVLRNNKELTIPVIVGEEEELAQK